MENGDPGKASPETSVEPVGKRPRVRRPPGLQLFASAEDEPRSRRADRFRPRCRPRSVVIIAGVASRLLTEFEQSVSGVVANVPGFFDALWRLMFWVPVAWSIAVLVVAVVRGRLALARDLVLATAVSLVGAAAVAADRHGRRDGLQRSAVPTSMVRRSSLPRCWSSPPRSCRRPRRISAVHSATSAAG